jgi:hypothetical protein
MALLDIENEEVDKPVKRGLGKGAKVAIGLALLIIVPAVATTLAGTIAINSGSDIAFGQGVVQAVACDSAITLTPTTSVVNVAEGGSFKVQTIVLSGIDDDCNGKTFKVQAFNDVTGSSALTLSTGPGSPACIAVPVLADGSMSPGSQQDNNCLATVNNSYSETDNTLTFTPGTVLDASTVFKFTLETV